MSKKITTTCKGADILPFDSLEEFQGGLKKISKANLEKLKRRIIRDGINVPVFVWRVNDWCRVLDGHQRLKALQSLREDGYELPLIPVAYIDAEDEADARQKLLGITSQFGEFEMEELSEWMAELDADVADTVRLADAEVKFEPEPVEIEEDEAPPVPEIPRTVKGDIYTLGNHRVMCGDSTIITDVEKLMDGKKAALVITDPPYNVAVNDESEESLKARNRRSDGLKSDGLKIANDKMDAGSFDKFLVDVFNNYYISMTDGASIYVFYADSMTIPFMTSFIGAGFHFAQNCIWNKQQFVMTRKDYHYKHEPVMYGWKDGAAHSWMADRKQSSVWSFDRPFKNDLHPTMKPIALLTYPLINSSCVGSLVLDLFLGSGSTLIACEQTNRTCYGMELDEKYCDVIVQRWVNFTGGKVILNGQEIEWNAK